MNKVILSGHLVRTPELKHVENSGMAICRFTIANNRGFGDKKKTIFINVVTFSKTAENCERFLFKGSKVAIVGELEIRQYTDNEGNNRYITEVIANEVEFLSSKNSTADEKPSGFEEIEDTDDLPF